MCDPYPIKEYNVDHYSETGDSIVFVFMAVASVVGIAMLLLGIHL